MRRDEIAEQAALYRRLSTAKYMKEETRARYLAVATSLEWMLSQSWRIPESRSP